MTEPTLVAWILYDATMDKKYIKKNPTDGSLAIFDSEEAATAAKRLHAGTDYKRCEYYSAPAEPEVSALVEALEGLMRVEARDRIMPVGEEWDAARAALAAHRKGGTDNE